MIEQAIIQVDEDGEFPNSALCAAYLGFRERGREVSKMTEEQIDMLFPRPGMLVFGGAHVVRGFLGLLGVEPEPLDYPECLRSFLGRDFSICKLSAIRRAYNDPGPSVFIKPVEHKAFTGHVVYGFRSLIKTSHLPSDTLVYRVGCVAFRSEWRFFVRNGQVVGVNHYKGDPLVFPDHARVRDAARLHHENGAPCAYALDFGVTEGAETLLVEANDMISLGSYGLDPVHYSFLIEERWKELVSEPVE